MLRRLIIDKERDLEIENDLLGTKCYANQLVDIIQNTSAEQAYTLGCDYLIKTIVIRLA